MSGAARPVLLLGSASIHVARFACGLCDAGQPVVLATHGALKMEPHALLREALQVNLSTLHWRGPRELRSLIERVQPRVVHAHQANSVGWHAARAVRGSGIPLVLTLWGSDVLSLPSRSPFHRWMVTQALRGADAWSADARVLLEAAQKLAGAAPRIEKAWIPLGIDHAPSDPGQAQERRILSNRLHKPLYRIDGIVRAFARIASRFPDWTLEVAAQGPDTPALQRLADELGVRSRIEFSGMLDAAGLARSYARAAVFASVPVTDGTSVSLLEAMAAGCLPVLSDLPANREWVADGRNGLLVGKLDQLDAALARAIAWWEGGRWQADGVAHNAALIRDKALFAGNIAQFLALYDRLRAP